MKRMLIVLAVFMFALSVCGYVMAADSAQSTTSTVEAKASVAASEQPVSKGKEFIVYTDKNARDNHYIPSGWMGDFGDIKINDQSADGPHGGATAIQYIYTAKKTGGKGWAGVYWQQPAQNWGDKKGGFDLTGMTKLSFWARGAKGGEVIKFKMGGIGLEPKKAYPDSTEAEVGPVELTDAWKQYTINLAGKDLSYINGGFCWVANADQNPDGATFYLDDIKYEADTSMKPEGRKQQNVPFYVYSDQRSSTNHFIPSGWMPDANTAKDLKFEGNSKEDPYLGDTCIKVTYKDVSGTHWAGIYWQNPANNWGNVDAGLDLSKATKLTFWARGAKGGENIQTFKIGGIMGEYSDSDSAEIGPVVLNKEWTQYTIDLKGKDLSYISGGFCFATNIDVNDPAGISFYLDEIKYE